MEHLKEMKKRLVECVERQINGNLEGTNTEELGEAVDMIKDLSEAIYYCTITEAMEEKSQPSNGRYSEARVKNYSPEHIMYASNGSGERHMPVVYYQDGENTSTRMYYSPEHSYPPIDVEYDGRSYVMRRKYMDGKKYNDKQTQMQELEKYAQELTSDITDMIKDASPEEKTMLQQKIQILASKIK